MLQHTRTNHKRYKKKRACGGNIGQALLRGNFQGEDEGTHFQSVKNTQRNKQYKQYTGGAVSATENKSAVSVRRPSKIQHSDGFRHTTGRGVDRKQCEKTSCWVLSVGIVLISATLVAVSVNSSVLHLLVLRSPPASRAFHGR